MATVNWNGISLLLEQVRPPAGHPELGLRPNCSELSAYSGSTGTQWVASTEAGPRHLVVYPNGMDRADALAYLAAEGYCESAGAKVGTIPLAANLPAELRAQGYSHNQVPTQLQLPAVAQVAAAPTQEIAQTTADPSQGGGNAGFILLAAIVLGGVGFASYVLTQKPKAASTTPPAPTPTDATNEPAAGTGEPVSEPAPPTKSKEPPKPISDFERANAELQELLGGFKKDV